MWKRRLKVGLVVGKIDPLVGKDETIDPVLRIGPFVGIGLFGGTGPVVSLTYMYKTITRTGAALCLNLHSPTDWALGMKRSVSRPF